MRWLLYACVVSALILSSQAQRVSQARSAQSTLKTATVHRGFLKAQEFLDMPEDDRGMYAMGFLDGMYLAPLFGAPEHDKALLSIAKCAEGMSASQVAAIIQKYVRDHPEQWHWDLSVVAFSAMREGCLPVYRP